MKKLLLFTLINFLSIITYAQGPAWLWAKSAGGTYDDIAYSIAVDNSGNIYMAGTFSSPTIMFGSTTLTCSSGLSDIFLVKFDSNGNVIWAKSAGGTDDDKANSISVDASGNIYITGVFKSTNLTFGTDTLVNIGNYDLFIAKYDANGNAVWAKSAGSTKIDWANSISIDAYGNTYITGWFYSTSITFGTTTLTNADNTGNTCDIFLVKYDTNGNILWAKSINGTGSDLANSIAVDAQDNIYIAGKYYSTTLTIGTTTLINAGQYDIFLAKYNSSGNALWAKSAGDAGGDVANSVTVDISGNIYETGSFGSATLTFGTTTLTNTSSYADIFIAKYDTNGNVLWAKSAGGTNTEQAMSVAAGTSGNTYIAGYFNSPTLTFGTTTLTNIDSTGLSSDIFIVKYDTYGNISWAKSAMGAKSDNAYSVAVDALGNTYLAGDFYNTSLTIGATVLSNAGLNDIFLAKIGSDNGINEINNPLHILVFPNPSAGNITINISEKSEIEIHNIEGQIIKSISANENNIIIDVSDFAKGMYFVKVMNDKGVIVKKFIKE